MENPSLDNLEEAQEEGIRKDYDRIGVSVISGCRAALWIDGLRKGRCSVIFVVWTIVMFCLCSETIIKWSRLDPPQSPSGLL